MIKTLSKILAIALVSSLPFISGCEKSLEGNQRKNKSCENKTKLVKEELIESSFIYMDVINTSMEAEDLDDSDIDMINMSYMLLKGIYF